MNKYAMVAKNTVEYIHQFGGRPDKVWKEQADSIFGVGSMGAVKGCPKCTFLGLCEEGLVKGIESGRYLLKGDNKNKEYGIVAVNLINRKPEYANNPTSLWNAVQNGVYKSHNAQMNIVCELYKAGYLLSSELK